MGVLREDEFETYLKSRITTTNGILIHGQDEAAIALLGRQAAKAIGGDIQRVDSAAAKAAPGAFMDDFLSLSLLDARQVLLVEDADEFSLKFLEPVFSATRLANFVVVLAAALGKVSRLRMAAEASARFNALAVYEENEQQLVQRLRKFLHSQNLRMTADAEAGFFAATGADRAMVLQEAEKLALYMLGKSEITAGDVSAICGNLAEFNSDELIDAALSGNLEETDRIASQLGAETRTLLPLMQLHLNRLQNLRAEIERGSSAEAALAAARPPVFFKRKPVLLQQLRKFSLSDLLEIQELFSAAILHSRRMAALSEAGINRSLLAIARMARSKSS